MAELNEQVARLEREQKSLEENFHLVIGPHGNIGKDIIELKKRVTALETELAKIVQAKQNKINKEAIE
jgi:predicted nuclease with TOPRIM domain